MVEGDNQAKNVNYYPFFGKMPIKRTTEIRPICLLINKSSIKKFFYSKHS